MGIKHSFVSGVPDTALTSLVRPTNWNADHTIDGDVDFNGNDIINCGNLDAADTLVIQATPPTLAELGDKYIDSDDKTAYQLTAQAWDADKNSTTITIEGLLATRASGGGNTNVLAVAQFTGKKVFAITPTFASGDIGIGIGIVDTDHETYLGDNAGTGNDGCLFSDGTWIANGGVGGGAAGSFASGDKVYVAVDPANARIWFKTNSGDWNNNPAADPGTNTGGQDLFFDSTIGPFFPGVTFDTVGQTALLDLDAAGVSLPTGFTAIGGDNYWASVVTLAGSSVVSIKDYGAVGDGVTNDTLAFQQFTDAFQGTPVELYIPPGRYLVTDTNIGAGIPKLKVHAYGVEFMGATDFNANNSWGHGAQILDSTDTYSARFASSDYGDDNIITLVTLADTAKFQADDWVLLTGLDTQGHLSQPVNPYIFEYIQIDTVNGGTGEITFKTSLQKKYRDTWPCFDDGTASPLDEGGPATMYFLNQDWDTEIEIYGMRNLNTPALGWAVLANGRKVKFTDCTFDHGGSGSMNQELIFDRCTLDTTDNSDIELDKCITSVVYKDCNIRGGLWLSSGSVETCTIDGCNFKTLKGGTKHMRILNSRIRDWQMPSWFGPSESAYLENAEIRNVFVNNIDGSNSQAISDFTFANGVLTKAISNPDDAIGWAVPGAVVLPIERSPNNWFPPFRVIDVRQVGTDLKIDTTLTASPPAFNAGTSAESHIPVHYWAHPCPKMTVVNCDSEMSHPSLRDQGFDPNKGRPWLSYRKRLVIGSQDGFSPKLKGYLVQATFRVLRAYSGTSGTLAFQFGGDYIDGTTSNLNVWTVSLDAKTLGLRTVTPGTSTNLGADSIPVLPAAGAWFINDVTNALVLSADITAEAASKWPIVEVIVETNHGFAEHTFLVAHNNELW